MLLPGGYTVDITQRCSSTTTAGAAFLTTASIDRSELTVLINAHVRTVYQQAAPIVGYMVRHGVVTCHTGKRKSRQASQGEAVAVYVTKGLFQGSIDFVAAERCRHQGCFPVSILFVEYSARLGNELLSRHGGRKYRVYSVDRSLFCSSSSRDRLYRIEYSKK